MKSRVFRSIAAMLSVLLLAGAPVKAAPVAIREVLQIVGNYQNPPELRLRSLSHTSAALYGINGSRQMVSGASQLPDSRSSNLLNSSLIPAPDSSYSLLSGMASSDLQRGTDIIDQGDVQGTICDCGEITLAGGFPKWPLLLLAGIPLFFINDRDVDIIPIEIPIIPITTPTPTPPSTPIPEPGSLLLLGSGLAGLGLGVRRRRAAARLAAPREDAG